MQPRLAIQDQDSLVSKHDFDNWGVLSHLLRAQRTCLKITDPLPLMTVYIVPNLNEHVIGEVEVTAAGEGIQQRGSNSFVLSEPESYHLDIQRDLSLSLPYLSIIMTNISSELLLSLYLYFLLTIARVRKYILWKTKGKSNKETWSTENCQSASVIYIYSLYLLHF